jgi:hypothetical protein
LMLPDVVLLVNTIHTDTIHCQYSSCDSSRALGGQAVMARRALFD